MLTFILRCDIIVKHQAPEKAPYFNIFREEHEYVNLYG